MKALTIWQPWASLIHIGAKPFEFRSWAPHRSSIGLRVVNHAAARPLNMNDVLRLLRHLESRHEDIVAATCLKPEIAIPFLKDLVSGNAPCPVGAGLGSFVLGEAKNGVEIAQSFGLSKVNDSDRDRHANYGWPIIDYEAFDEPIQIGGRQGLWNWPSPEDLLNEMVPA